jgi:ABC-type branched-subunit amino acid transport system ATPase component
MRRRRYRWLSFIAGWSETICDVFAAADQRAESLENIAKAGSQWVLPRVNRLRVAKGTFRGQQKLLELARILVLDPKAVLFDEPLAGMHSDLCRLFIDGVQEMLSGAVSIMLVCHDPCFIGSRSISL